MCFLSSSHLTTYSVLPLPTQCRKFMTKNRYFQLLVIPLIFNILWLLIPVEHGYLMWSVSLIVFSHILPLHLFLHAREHLDKLVDILWSVCMVLSVHYILVVLLHCPEIHLQTSSCCILSSLFLCLLSSLLTFSLFPRLLSLHPRLSSSLSSSLFFEAD